MLTRFLPKDQRVQFLSPHNNQFYSNMRRYLTIKNADLIRLKYASVSLIDDSAYSLALSLKGISHNGFVVVSIDFESTFV